MTRANDIFANPKGKTLILKIIVILNINFEKIDIMQNYWILSCMVRDENLVSWHKR